MGGHCPGIEAFGGYLMNSCHGGMNPRAVLTALHLEGGCRFISLAPTARILQASSKNRRWSTASSFHSRMLYPGVHRARTSVATRIPLEDPVPHLLRKSSQMIAAKPEVYLNTGHVSGPEVMRILDLAERFKIRKVLIAHPARLQLTSMSSMRRRVAVPSSRHASSTGTIPTFRGPTTTSSRNTCTAFGALESEAHGPAMDKADSRYWPDTSCSARTMACAPRPPRSRACAL